MSEREYKYDKATKGQVLSIYFFFSKCIYAFGTQKNHLNETNGTQKNDLNETGFK